MSVPPDYMIYGDGGTNPEAPYAPGAEPVFAVVYKALWDARDSGEEVAELAPFIRRDADKVVAALKALPDLRDAGIARLQETLRKEGQAHDNTIRQRDATEEALSAAYGAVMGYSPEWSSHYGFDDAVSDIEDRVMALEAENEALRLALGLNPDPR